MSFRRPRRPARSGPAGTPLWVAAGALVLALVGATAGHATWSAFSTTTANPGNTATAASVTLTDNDSGTAMLSLSDAVPGTSDTGCIQVTYSGTASALVRMYGTTTGTGLDTYLDLVVTRGTVSSGAFDSCANFTADATNYLGAGNGVIYSGTLAAYADSFSAGTVDPTAASVETWTTSEVHAYKFSVTLQSNTSAQSLTATQTFTWEARNAGSYANVVNADSPVGYWRLGETSGTTATSATGSYNGSYVGTPTLGTAAGIVDTDPSVTLDGSTQYVSVAYNAALNTTPFTLEAWAKPVAGAAGMGAVITNFTGIKGARIYYENVGATWNAVIGDNGSSWTLVGPSAPLNTWAHLAATWDGTTFTLYVNGVNAAASPNGRIYSVNTTRPTGIGAEHNGAGFQYIFKGSIDEAAYYNKALSAARITAHYNAGH